MNLKGMGRGEQYYTPVSKYHCNLKLSMHSWLHREGKDLLLFLFIYSLSLFLVLFLPHSLLFAASVLSWRDFIQGREARNSKQQQLVKPTIKKKSFNWKIWSRQRKKHALCVKVHCFKLIRGNFICWAAFPQCRRRLEHCGWGIWDFSFPLKGNFLEVKQRGKDFFRMFLEQSLPRICLPGETRGYFSFILLREISIHVQHVSNALDTIVFFLPDWISASPTHS